MKPRISITILLTLILAELLYGQLERIDSLEKTLDTAGIEVKSRTLTELSWAYRSLNPELGVEHGIEALEYIYKLGDKVREAECLMYIGVNYFMLNELEEATEYFLQSMKIKEDLNDQQGIAALLNNLGNISREMGNYEKAIEYYYQVKEIGESANNTRIISTALANLAVNFKTLDDYKRALEYNLEALRLREESGDQHGVAGSLNNIAVIYADSAFSGLDLKRALEYFHRSLAIKEEIGDRLGMSKTMVNIGQLNADIGDFITAKPYYNRALEIAKDLKATNIEMACYAHLSYYYEKAGNYKNALHYQILYTDLMDSVYMEENEQQIAEMMVRFETEKKEKENELLRQQSQIQKLEINKHRIMRNYFIVLAVLLLLLAGVVYNRYLLKQRTNKLLEEKNDQLALVNATKDKFFSIISHDLKNPFGTLIQVSGQLEKRYDELDDKQKMQIINLINNTASITHDLLANLLEWAVVQSGNLEVEKEVIDLASLVDQCVELLKLNAEKKGIRLLSEIQPGTRVFADRNMVETILRNLVSNAIKFTEKKGDVKISSLDKAEVVEIRVEDEGIGISAEDISKLFRIDMNTRHIGRSQEKGTGLGLILCREFVEKNGGSIRAESVPGKGSSFIFTLLKPTEN